jgi:hypothetical protein
VQNEANQGAGAPRLRIGDCRLWTERRWLWAGAGGKMRKTNPISPARPGMGAGWWGAMPRRSVIVQNEANFEVSSVKSERSNQ